MHSITALDQVAGGFTGSAVTIGKFDGIHLGHQKLIQELSSAAQEHAIQSVVVTFDRHPDALLKPGHAKLPLIGPTQKHDLIEAQGADILVTLPFDEKLAQLDPKQFVQLILVDGLRAKIVLVGEDFRFGNKGAGDVDLLRELGQQLGFEVRVVSSEMLDGVKISSSAIREALDRGDVTTANKMLGHVHSCVGMIEHGLKIGRSIGFPTANMARDCEGYLPLDGVYAGWLVVDQHRYPAAHSVGINETFQAVPRLVESHILDRDDVDLYDKIVTLEFIEFIRPAAKFNGVEDLVEEINRDLAKIRTVLAV
ncbi:bifunctional riboflavin kinase/FAD synthetase [Rhodoluna lacicola]|uniref:bifunctional riboflavin kinase/FAD synthetase n=1 Tax=Rhodoluna lacicola TaxID=529884 RepID=UPI0022307EAA|nr:bifunctional riboflavin kinase/FAD synthetase [Rhodoluna lacicola]BDS50173.1 riboflavin biosynthesis protein [Rhodoluna lacicola]